MGDALTITTADGQVDLEKVVANGTVSWANSDPANTEKNVDLDITGPNPGRLLLVIVRNTSIETTLGVRLKYEWVDPQGSTTRYAFLSTPSGIVDWTASLLVTDGQGWLVDGGLLAAGGRLNLRNLQAVGAAGAFTASVQVHALSGV